MSLRKTEVVAIPLHTRIAQRRKKSDESKSPIHNELHLLGKRHGFRGKHLDKSNAYLKKCVWLSIYQCASSLDSGHLSNEEHGGDQERSSSPELTSKCTKRLSGCKPCWTIIANG